MNVGVVICTSSNVNDGIDSQTSDGLPLDGYVCGIRQVEMLDMLDSTPIIPLVTFVCAPLHPWLVATTLVLQNK